MDIELNRTFAIHRMRIPTSLKTPPPDTLSRRLRDYLVGDSVRGVEISGLDESSTVSESSGALISVDWQQTVEEDEATDKIELTYEKTAYLARLFPSRSLLMICSPAPIRNALVRFLTQTFDTRVSPLAVNPDALVRILDTWLENGGPIAKKDIVVTLGFGEKISSGGLRSLDISIPSEDVRSFVEPGQGTQKFSKTLASYVDRHLALDMGNSEVKVTKIICGGFVLGEGRLKLLEEDAVAIVLDGISQELKSYK